MRDYPNSRFFRHTECEFFPCHKTNAPEDFNCLFCFCPLYALGEKCGGNYQYTERGVKDCKNCLTPHGRASAEYIYSRFPEISKLAERKSE
jgi:Zn-finger protein